MSEDKPTFLPNLVGGVSIWKLGVDLNEPKFFDGRLLVPETEGSESLPVTVRWDLTGLVPLEEARAKYPEDVEKAVADFRAALDRVAKVFATPGSGYDKYKEAFTVPSIEGGTNYFYSPEKKKLFVINWGASPRAMGGKAEHVFGYQDWGRVFEKSSAFALTAATPVDGAPAVKPADPPKKEEKKEPKKADENKRPWWIWPLLALVAIALVLLALFLMRSCEEPKTPAPDAAAEAATDVAGDAEEATDAADDAADETEDAGDAGESGDGGDAGGEAGADGGKDGGGEAGADDDDEDDDVLGGSSGGASGGASGGTTIVTIGPGGGEKSSVHRKHFAPDAVRWRVTSGKEKISRTEQRGGRFDVWLTPGSTFEGVRVEWQDASGKWHVH